jgi:hypothetical protein
MMMLGKWIKWMFLFEGVAMLLTAPVLMFYGSEVLELYATVSSPLAIRVGGAVVPWFGALVLLMGWLECRVGGRLSVAEVEAWLIADIAYVVALARFVHEYTSGWNLWSFAFSALFPLLWAPVRIYWLLFLRSYD